MRWGWALLCARAYIVDESKRALYSGGSVPLSLLFCTSKSSVVTPFRAPSSGGNVPEIRVLYISKPVMSNCAGIVPETGEPATLKVAIAGPSLYLAGMVPETWVNAAFLVPQGMWELWANCGMVWCG